MSSKKDDRTLDSFNKNESFKSLLKSFFNELTSKNSIPSFVVLFFVVSISLLFTFYFYRSPNPFIKTRSPLNIQIDSLKEELYSLQNLLVKVKSDIDTLQKVKLDNQSNNSVTIDLKLKLLDQRMSKLENVLLEDPEKAVTAILQKKDIENQENKIEQMAKFLDQSIGYMYSLIVSVVVVIAVGFFTVAMSLKKG
jgi:lipopolysaccharide export LptBFGC system permease protein LptF